MDFEKILSVLEVLIEDQLSEIELPKGKRGLRGPQGLDGANGKDGKDGLDGKSFSFKEHKKEIQNIIIKNKSEFKGDQGPRGLKGRDGLNGLDGKDGISFDWDKYKDLIFNRIDSNKLTFSDFTEDEKKQLRGARGLRGQKGVAGQDGIDGRDGRDGKDFSWEERFSDISNLIKDHSLTFSKLTVDEKEELRGERGPRGQRGRSGENGLNAFELWSKENNGDQADFLKSLVGKTGTPGLQGIKGERGLKGEKGDSGEDGLDAPAIVDIELKEWNDKFYFSFIFDNGNRIETKKINKPALNQIIQNFVTGGGGGHRNYLSTDISYDVGNKVTVVNDYLKNDLTQIGRKNEITYDGVKVDYITESLYNGDIGNLIVQKRIDLIYTGNNVTSIKVLDI